MKAPRATILHLLWILLVALSASVVVVACAQDPELGDHEPGDGDGDGDGDGGDDAGAPGGNCPDGGIDAGDAGCDMPDAAPDAAIDASEDNQLR